MILEEETFEAYGYYPSDLKPKSGKRILAACELCGKVRVLKKQGYRALCGSCCQMGDKSSWFGRHHSAVELAKMCLGARKGDKNPMFGRTGDKHPRWNGGTKAAGARNDAKRRRELGYVVLMPLADGEVGHHATNDYVVGVPAEVHQRFCGHSREKHRALILEWLKLNDKKKYLKVLCVLTKESLK